MVALAVGTAAVIVLVAVGVVGWLRPHTTTSSTPGAAISASPRVSVATSSGRPSATRSTASPSATASGKPSATPSSKASKTASGTASSKASAKPSTSSSAGSSAHPSRRVPAVSRDFDVVVLNETPIRGLAASVAARLRALGWPVTGVGNWTGEIPATTVYYPNGQYDRALRLAADLHVTRVRHLVQHMLPNHLTVVLHDPPG